MKESFSELYSIATSKNAWMSDLWEDGNWSPRFTRQELEEVQTFFRRLFAHSISLETNNVMVWVLTKDVAFFVKS